MSIASESYLADQRSRNVLALSHSNRELFQSRMSCFELSRNGEYLRHPVPFYLDVGIRRWEGCLHPFYHDFDDFGLVPLEILPCLAWRYTIRYQPDLSELLTGHTIQGGRGEFPDQFIAIGSQVPRMRKHRAWHSHRWGYRGNVRKLVQFHNLFGLGCLGRFNPVVDRA